VTAIRRRALCLRRAPRLVARRLPLSRALFGQPGVEQQPLRRTRHDRQQLTNNSKDGGSAGSSTSGSGLVAQRAAPQLAQRQTHRSLQLAWPRSIGCRDENSDGSVRPTLLVTVYYGTSAERPDAEREITNPTVGLHASDCRSDCIPVTSYSRRASRAPVAVTVSTTSKQHDYPRRLRPSDCATGGGGTLQHRPRPTPRRPHRHRPHRRRPNAIVRTAAAHTVPPLQHRLRPHRPTLQRRLPPTPLSIHRRRQPGRSSQWWPPIASGQTDNWRTVSDNSQEASGRYVHCTCRKCASQPCRAAVSGAGGQQLRTGSLFPCCT